MKIQNLTSESILAVAFSPSLIVRRINSIFINNFSGSNICAMAEHTGDLPVRYPCRVFIGKPRFGVALAANRLF